MIKLSILSLNNRVCNFFRSQDHRMSVTAFPEGWDFPWDERGKNFHQTCCRRYGAFLVTYLIWHRIDVSHNPSYLPCFKVNLHSLWVVCFYGCSLCESVTRQETVIQIVCFYVFGQVWVLIWLAVLTMLRVENCIFLKLSWKYILICICESCVGHITEHCAHEELPFTLKSCGFLPKLETVLWWINANQIDGSSITPFTQALWLWIYPEFTWRSCLC